MRRHRRSFPTDSRTSVARVEPNAHPKSTVRARLKFVRVLPNRMAFYILERGVCGEFNVGTQGLPPRTWGVQRGLFPQNLDLKTSRDPTIPQFLNQKSIMMKFHFRCPSVARYHF